MNILSNASKYSDDGTTITLSAVISGGWLSVSVEDHGVGIAPEDQKKLFTKFFRVDSELTRKVPGTGLGMSIIKAIVEGHGGSVTVTSQAGIGTTVNFAIPVPVVSVPVKAADPAISDGLPQPVERRVVIDSRLYRPQPPEKQFVGASSVPALV
jgi:signal transduction histidine kinase